MVKIPGLMTKFSLMTYDETYMDRTVEQRSHHTTDNKREGAHVREQNLTHDKKRKINLISYMVLVMILYMLLLEHSNYTHKKREAAKPKTWCRIRISKGTLLRVKAKPY